MHPSTVVLIAFATSAVTSLGTVYVLEQYDIFAPKVAAAPGVVVPDLRGLLEADAQSSAATAHLALFVATREPTAEAKPGTVVRQSLAPGLHVNANTPVSVVLAAEVQKVPDVGGITLDEARMRLEKGGYEIQVGAPLPHASAAPGLVVAQAPKADSTYAKGGVVVIQLSSGPAEVEVPKFIGTGYASAKEKIESLGLKMLVGWTEFGETPEYVVLNQRPAPGTKLKPGGQVVLTVNR